MGRGKWLSPHMWLNDRAKEKSPEELRQIIYKMSNMMTTREIENLFCDDMDRDGYYAKAKK